MTLPEEMWFGTTGGQWKIQCWESETHAMAWAAEATSERGRRLWKAKVCDAMEFKVVEPKPYLQAVDS